METNLVQPCSRAVYWSLESCQADIGGPAGRLDRILSQRVRAASSWWRRRRELRRRPARAGGCTRTGMLLASPGVGQALIQLLEALAPHLPLWPGPQ